MAPADRLLHDACSQVADGLRQFGYRHVTAALIKSHYDHWKAGGEPKADIIYKFAVGEFEKNPEIFGQPDSDPPIPNSGIMGG